MKIILLEHVRKVGQKGEIVEVSDGFANNFLIKKGLAKIAVGGITKEIENKKKIKAQQEIEQIKIDTEKFQKVNQAQFKIQAKANKEGHLFAAIHKKDIAKEIGLQEENINLQKEIKSLGQFEVQIKIGENKGKVFLVITE